MTNNALHKLQILFSDLILFNSIRSIYWEFNILSVSNLGATETHITTQIRSEIGTDYAIIFQAKLQ